MGEDRSRRTREELARLARRGSDWVSFVTEASAVIDTVVPFDRCCWHTIDPGTVLFTGSVTRDITCSGSWLAEHEYVIEDVNKWWYLARSGRRAGATSLATHGDLSRSARHRSQSTYGIGDELRGSFVADGRYWGAGGFLRDRDRPWFTDDDVRFLASLSDAIGAGLCAALVTNAVTEDVIVAADGPGVVVFDDLGRPEFISPSAEYWIEQLIEEPAPHTPAESKMVQAVATRARSLGTDNDPVRLAARSRLRTRSGAWLPLYGTPLAGGAGARVAVILQPATPNEVAALVALAYGQTERERHIVQLCMQGQSTKQMAASLHVSAYTVQDHLKSVFDKTSVRTRNELVGQIFLEHYAPRWEDVGDSPSGWQAKTSPEPS